MSSISKVQLFTHSWLPVLLWMLLIFLFSSQAYSGAVTATYFGSWNVPVRKFAHLAEYFVLAVLARRAFAQSGGVFADRQQLFTLVLCAVNAFLDEWHQSFVPGRSACLCDALVDILGAALAILVMKAIAKTRVDANRDPRL
ncbi:MAG: VanZ family protein [Candidatus Melainabacteria bacterium]|nr:MAG: VanZ family protein [Candidatus Melainabacteria bacterium]